MFQLANNVLLFCCKYFVIDLLLFGILKIMSISVYLNHYLWLSFLVLAL
jgi:hypothetical protein